MAIRTVVTRGYGNGVFSGSISLVVLRGYAIGIQTDLFNRTSLLGSIVLSTSLLGSRIIRSSLLGSRIITTNLKGGVDS